VAPVRPSTQRVGVPSARARVSQDGQVAVAGRLAVGRAGAESERQQRGARGSVGGLAQALGAGAEEEARTGGGVLVVADHAAGQGVDHNQHRLGGDVRQ
jgi:hypothetical protein